jgi:uncharacterized protein (DUF2062 family)
MFWPGWFSGPVALAALVDDPEGKRMLFKSRRVQTVAERFRLALWPRRSWTRSLRYVLLRLQRLPSSPHKIALGCAAGVFAVFTPFLGLQLMLAGILSLLFRGSVVASFLASFVGNPLTYPVIWFATFNLGNVLLGGTASAQLVDLRGKAGDLGDGFVALSPGAIATAAESLWPILKPMVVGSVPLGGIAAATAYVSVHRLISVSRASKRLRLAGAAPHAWR